MGNHASIQQHIHDHSEIPNCIRSIIDSYVPDCEAWDGEKRHRVNSIELKNVKNIITITVTPPEKHYS